MLAAQPNLLAEFRAIMADPMGPNPSEAQCRAVIEHRAAQYPTGPEVWAIWHLPHGSDLAAVCEFDGCVCYECYADPVEALDVARRLNSDGYSRSGKYIVARLPRGVAANNEQFGEVSAAGPDVPYVAGMECSYVTCSARVADLEVFTGAPIALVSAQQANGGRRGFLRTALAAGLLATTAAPAAPANMGNSHIGPALRGDDTARLPDQAALWSRMPLPFTPAEAWHLLSPATQAEIGAAVIGMALADYVSGDMHDEADHFHDDALRGDCMDVRDTLLKLPSP